MHPMGKPEEKLNLLRLNFNGHSHTAIINFRRNIFYSLKIRTNSSTTLGLHPEESFRQHMFLCPINNQRQGTKAGRLHEGIKALNGEFTISEMTSSILKPPNSCGFLWKLK